jgi:hypothetical protein
MKKHKTAIILAALLLGGGVALYLYKKRKTAQPGTAAGTATGDPKGSIQIVGGSVTQNGTTTSNQTTYPPVAFGGG